MSRLCLDTDSEHRDTDGRRGENSVSYGSYFSSARALSAGLTDRMP